MSETKESNPKDDAAAGTRVDLSVFPMTAVIHGALAMTEGHLKYGAYNYRIAGVKSSVYLAALRRHVIKWENGQEQDPKTLVHHLGNAAACIAILLDAIECGKLIDDRPPKIEGIDEMFEWAEATTAHLHSIFPPGDGPGRFTQEGQREKETIDSPDTIHVSASSWGMFPNSSGD